MNEAKSARKKEKGESLEFTKEKISDEILEQIEEIFQKFFKKQEENSNKTMQEWLLELLEEEFPEKEGREVFEITKEIADSVKFYEKELEDFNQSIRTGITKESWFLEKLQDKAKGLSADYFGNLLFEMNDELVKANQKMGRILANSNEKKKNGLKLKKTIRKCKIRWNSYNTKEVALELGREAKSQLTFWQNGMTCLNCPKILEAIEKDKNYKLKVVAAGALKVAGEKKMLPYGFHQLTTECLTKIACMSVDNLKTVWRISKGEQTMREASDEIEKRILVLYSSFDMQNRGALYFYAPLLGEMTESMLYKIVNGK